MNGRKERHEGRTQVEKSSEGRQCVKERKNARKERRQTNTHACIKCMGGRKGGRKERRKQGSKTRHSPSQAGPHHKITPGVNF